MKSRKWQMQCISCGRETDTELPSSACRTCGELLEITLRGKSLSRGAIFERKGDGIWRFRAALPFSEEVEAVTLNEGGTPLVRLRSIGAAASLETLYAKNDGQNPTGSFKDRGMSCVVTRAKEIGSRALVCASTGNTAASLAAYAARARIPAVVVVPQGKVAKGKLGQAFAYGARVFGVEGSFDAALKTVFELVREDRRFYLVNSVNPFRIEGQKVAAYEIYEQLARVPDYVVLPVGNAGNISAIWKGFKELRAFGVTKKLPKMVGVQAEGAAPFAEALAANRDLRPWSEPQTIASAIRIGNPVSWRKALAAVKDSGGTAVTVSDREILDARTQLGRKEGLLVEAASAAPIAALRKLKLPRKATTVCIATGNGLKDISDHELRMEIEPATSAASIAKAVA